MSVRYYDEALVNKIKRWVIDPNMKILGPNEAKQMWRIESDRDFDKAMTLPLITLTRDGYCEVINTNKQALSYDGGHIDIVSERKSGVLNAIPIKLSYELSVYTRYFDEADEYARNFIFNLVNYPTVDINIPYQNANIMHRSKIYLNNRVEDNLNDKLVRDQFTRITLSLDINDAYLFSIPIYYNYEMDDSGDIYVVNDLNEVEEIIKA